MAPSSGRSEYTAACRNASLEGGSPDSRLPSASSFEIRAGGEAAMIVGDAIGNHHVAFARPEWPGGSDQDPETAARTRTRLLDRLVSDQMTLVGFHLPNGGIGRVEKATDGFRFVPEGA